MQQSILSFSDLYKRAEGHDVLHCTVVHLSDLRNEDDLLDRLDGAGHSFSVVRADLHDAFFAFFFNGNAGSGIGLDALDDLSARSDHRTDEFLRNAHHFHAWSVRLIICPWSIEGLEHLVQNVQSAGTGLHECFLQDLVAQTADLDVHLTGSDPVLGTSDLEVHVAKVVLVTENVGENSIIATVLVGDQSHRNSAHRLFDLDATVHHGQCSCANSCHGRRTIGFEDVRNDADHIGVVRRNHALQCTLCKVSVSDLPAAGSANGAGFTCGERREVVMQIETLCALVGRHVDAVLIQTGSECDRGQGLGFTASEYC